MIKSPVSYLRRIWRKDNVKDDKGNIVHGLIKAEIREGTVQAYEYNCLYAAYLELENRLETRRVFEKDLLARHGETRNEVVRLNACIFKQARKLKRGKEKIKEQEQTINTLWHELGKPTPPSTRFLKEDVNPKGLKQ